MISNSKNFRIITIDDFVADRIMKGADLLSPAVEYQNSLAGLKLQEKVLLRSKNNNNPFAIGILYISYNFVVIYSSTIQNKLLQVYHWWTKHTSMIIIEKGIHSIFYYKTKEFKIISLN